MMKPKDLLKRGSRKDSLLSLRNKPPGKAGLAVNGTPLKKTGLYCSLILRPPIPVSKASFLTFLGGVALLETIRNETSLSPLLKWPNDVMLYGKKICAILTESASKHSRVKFAVLGIGANLNNKKEQFPENLRSKSTSLMIETEINFNREKFLASQMFYLEKNYSDFLKEGNKKILMFWRENNDTGKKVTICRGKKLIVGLAKDINENGNLLLQLNNGRLEIVVSGELR